MKPPKAGRGRCLLAKTGQGGGGEGGSLCRARITRRVSHMLRVALRRGHRRLYVLRWGASLPGSPGHWRSSLSQALGEFSSADAIARFTCVLAISSSIIIIYELRLFETLVSIGGLAKVLLLLVSGFSVCVRVWFRNNNIKFKYFYDIVWWFFGQCYTTVMWNYFSAIDWLIRWVLGTIIVVVVTVDPWM